MTVEQEQQIQALQAENQKLRSQLMQYMGDAVEALADDREPEWPLQNANQKTDKPVGAPAADELYVKAQRALSRSEEVTRQMILLNDLSRQMNLASQVEEVYDIVALFTPQIIQADRVSAALLSKDQKYFEIITLEGEKEATPQGELVPLQGTDIERAITDNRLVIRLDTPDETTIGHMPSRMIAPLGTAGGRTLGTLNVGCHRTYAYSLDDQNLLHQIASLAASKIESQQLLDQTQIALAETESLYKASSQVIGSLTIETALHALVYNSPFQHFDRVTLLFFNKTWADEQPDFMTPLALWERDNEKPTIPAGTHYTLVEFPIIGLFSRDEPTILADIATDERTDPNTRTYFLEELKMRSLVIFPLVAGGKWIGVITGQNHSSLNLTETDIRQLSSLTDQTATVIQNQRLFEQTQQRAAELEEATNFLDSIIENIPMAIFIKEAETLKFVWVNRANEQGFEFNRDELLGKNDYDLLPKAEADVYAAKDREVLAGGELVDYYEESVHTAHEGVRLLHTRKVPIFGLDGQPKYLLGIMEDITDLRQAETEQVRLLDEVKRLAAIVENHPDFIGVGTLDGQALYVNPAGLRMMGLPPDYDVTQMTASYFYSPEDVDRLMREGIPTAMETGSWSAEANLLRVDGTTVPVEETIGINYGAADKPDSFSITMRDVSARKAAEAERERLLIEIEGAYRQYIRQEWEQYLTEQHQGKWHIEHQTADLAQKWESNGSSATISRAISLRGQAIGSLQLQDIEPDRNWTTEELALVETVSEQLGLTIENLRLFDDTQQRAAREQITREITDKMRAAPDVDSIIQTGLTELAKALAVPRAYVKLDTGSRISRRK